MKYLCFLPAWLSLIPCQAQTLRSAQPARYFEAGIYSMHFTDVFSFTGNQASLSQVKNISVGVYSERKFLLRELQRFSSAISFPCFEGGTGISIDYSGFKYFNELHAGLAYGRSLGEKIDLGIQFNYHRISMPVYGSAGAINVELGTILHLTDKLQTGFHIYNPFGGKFGKNSREKMASLFSFGTGYEASEKLFLTAGIVKEEDQPVTVNASIQYAFVERFFMRGGIASVPGSYFAGAGFSWKNTRLDMIADWHPLAGLTPSLLLIFNVTQNKNGQE